MRCLILFALLVFGCTREKKIENTADRELEVAKKQSNSIDSCIISIESNPIDNELLYRDEFDNYINFRKGHYKLPTPIVISDGLWRHQTNFVIDHVSDTIHFIIDPIDKYWKAVTKTKHASLELNFDVEFRKNVSPIKTFDEFSFSKAEYKKLPSLRDRRIDSVYNIKLKYVTAYAAKNKLNKSFIQKWKTFIQYEKLLTRITIDFNLDGWDKQYLESLVSEAKQLHSDSNLFNPYYRMSMWNSLAINHYLKYSKTSRKLSEYYDLIDKNFKGDTQEHLLAYLLCTVKDRKHGIVYNQAEFDSLHQLFLATDLKDETREYVTNSNILAKIDSKKTNLIDHKNRTVQLKEIAKAHRFTYIDFWATWCAPCRSEMPESKILKKEFKDKGIQFIYISIDKNPAAWNRIARQIGLSESYIIPDFEVSPLAKDFDISTIPRYVLLNENGVVVNANAPRPSDKRIRQYFESILNEM